MVEFNNVTAADAPLLPPVLEFSYLLAIQPSPPPMSVPTLSPTTTPVPTFEWKQTGVPSVPPTSDPTLSPTSGTWSLFNLVYLVLTSLLGSFVASWW